MYSWIKEIFIRYTWGHSFQNYSATKVGGIAKKGFGKYMSEKEKQIRKKISSEKRKIIVSLFTLPKAILTIGCLLLLLYPFTRHQYSLVKPMAIGLSALSIMSMISFFVYWIWVKKKNKK